MSASVSCALAVGKLTPLLMVQQEEALPHLDVLWHYECVVGPRSPATSSWALSPRSDGAMSEDSHAGTPTSVVISQSPAALYALSDGEKPTSDVAQVEDVKRSIQEASYREPVERPLALQRVFNTFDENGDGRVSIQELGRIFERLGISKTQESIESLLADSSSLVIKAQGHVDEEEFARLYESACFDCEGSEEEGSRPDLHADVDRDLRAAFHVFDKDHNGFISPTELQSVLCCLGFPQAKELRACVEMIARVDENGDGQVDFFEFKKLFHFEDPMSIPTY